MKRALLLLLICFVAVPVMAATVYRWVDSDGVVHYSDQPHKGAKKADLGTLQVIEFSSPRISGSLETSRGDEEEKRPNYEVTILAPVDGTTLRPANQQVHVRVRIAPALGPRAVLQYKYDGKPLGKPTTAMRALIKQVYRGTHTLNVTVLPAGAGSSGKPLASASSTFYVHQHSILNNPNNQPGPHPGPGGG